MSNLSTKIMEHNTIMTKLYDQEEVIDQVGNLLKEVLKTNKVLVCGNGGSASDANHFVAELMVKFKNPRNPLPALSLCNNTALLTAHCNDLTYSTIFSRQIEALGNKDDILIAISTSGTSMNILQAVQKAIDKNIKVILLTGDKIQLNGCININVPSSRTDLIQEAHIFLLHFWCEYLE